MREHHEQKEVLIQNLQDAGCSRSLIEQFLQSRNEGDTATQASLLAQQRNRLLSGVHEAQNKLDCLDYLLFQLKKKKQASRPPSHTP